ncbi:hypothetical protein BUALT_Bualt19G0030800 [Buddleja alternifolia]|uniref:Uncharacterized protein n=1 Tax=Buddleja alternifolia TaxID=168488 RepID=A0AAV6W906_9LAMI|nr:hypothetical protein BUALT_Bualt19G0030800 [Buddleja alternifolia]
MVVLSCVSGVFDDSKLCTEDGELKNDSLSSNNTLLLKKPSSSLANHDYVEKINEFEFYVDMVQHRHSFLSLCHFLLYREFDNSILFDKMVICSLKCGLAGEGNSQTRLFTRNAGCSFELNVLPCQDTLSDIFQTMSTRVTLKNIGYLQGGLLCCSSFLALFNHRNKENNKDTVPRHGKLGYQNHGIFWMRLSKTCSLIIGNVPTKCFRIADLGCSSGPNTLFLVSHIIEKIEELCMDNNLSRSVEFEVLLNDLPENDFNNVFKMLPSFHHEKLNNDEEKDIKCFISGLPGSFYGRLLPSKSLNFVYSSYSLHWLSQANDPVLKKVEIYEHGRKLDPNWEEPYKVMEILKQSIYKLEDLQVFDDSTFCREDEKLENDTKHSNNTLLLEKPFSSFPNQDYVEKINEFQFYVDTV